MTIAIHPKIKKTRIKEEMVWKRKPLTAEDVLNRFDEQVDELHHAIKERIGIVVKAQEMISENFKIKIFNPFDNPITFTRVRDVEYEEFYYHDAPLDILTFARESYARYIKETKAEDSTFPPSDLVIHSGKAQALELRSDNDNMDPVFYISQWDYCSISFSDNAKHVLESCYTSGWNTRELKIFEDVPLTRKLTIAKDNGLVYATDRIIGNLIQIEKHITEEDYGNLSSQIKDGLNSQPYTPSKWILQYEGKQDQRVGMMSSHPDFNKYSPDLFG